MMEAAVAPKPISVPNYSVSHPRRW